MRQLLFFLLFIGGVTVSAQPYGFLTWSVEDGLPQSQVTALAEDARGYLWVGTNGGGLARFDGEEFQPYGVADGLADNFVRGLTTDPEGNLYAITKRGAAILHPDSLTFAPLQIPEPGSLFGADAGALQWSKLQWEDGQRQLVYTTTTERYVLQKSVGTWVVSRDANLYIQDGPEITFANGRILKGSRNRGLFLLRRGGEPIANYTEEAGDLPHNYVLSLLEDRQGRAWVGTSGGGLVRMIPTGLRYFDTGDGLLGERIYATYAASDGKIWVAASGKGLQYRENGRFQTPANGDPTQNVKVASITEDVSGRIYAATDGRGVVMLDSNRVLTRRSGLSSDYILKLFNVGGNTIIAATYAKGLNAITYFTDRDTFAIRTYGTADSLQLLSLSSIIRYQNGFLLGGTDGRIQHWELDGSLENPISRALLDERNGLPPGRISAMLLRQRTQLWVAVQGYGLFYTDLRAGDPRFFPLPNRLRDISSNIFQLAQDPNVPALWLGTERGLIRLYLNRDGQPDYAQEYGRAEGFLGGETTRDAVTVDSLGRLWFGTLNGLVRYEEDRTDSYLAPPPTFIERVNLFYAAVEPSDFELRGTTPYFAARNNHFQFRYAAVDLTYPDKLRYRFRLKGETREWSPLTDERAVRYAGLSPGRYTFLVEATTDGGKTFGEPASYGFQIATPLLRSGWFLGLLTLLIGGLIVGLSYGFYRRVQRRELVLRRELETQNRLLGLEQKARQLQMNPHFIFNALNSIRGLVDGNNDAEARAQITKFATLMRGILNNSRREMVSLEDEINVLREYIEMERFCQKFPIEYRIEVPEDIDPEEVSLPPMLLQPFVENAILHGLAGRENGGRVDVRFFLRGRRMQCLVVDDGVGRAVAAQRKLNRQSKHRSVAIEVTGERLRASGGTLTIRDREGGGTEVELLVPVEMW